MRIAILMVAATLCLSAVPAFACKVLVKYPEHIEDTAYWAHAYRIVEIIEATDDRFVVLVIQHFGDKTNDGKRVSLRFIAGEEPHAICPITLEVGKTYLIRSRSTSEPLLISRFDWMNIPSTHPKYSVYVRDLELVSAS
jgi:hypothetical protein